MRLLVINYEYPPIGGGGGFVTRDILEHIGSLGHNVTIITSGNKWLKAQEIANNVHIIRVPTMCRNKLETASMISMLSYVPSSILKALLELKGDMYDIINTHFAIPSGPSGHALSKIFRLPNVLSIHGGDIYDPSKSLSPHKIRPLSATVSYMLNKADRIVAQSNDTRDNAYSYYNVKKDIDIIPLGIKKHIVERKSRYDFGIDQDETIFCSIGRLIKRKNIDETLLILSGLNERFKFKFLIIGDGPERRHLEGLVKQLGLYEVVWFMGNVSDKEKFQLLDVSDFYLSTALHEGFGLVFLEAMECGLPVICYNRGGQNDFLINGKTGFIVNFRDIKSFSERLVELMTNSELKKNMSTHNREHVKKYYINVCAEKYISLFEDVISKNRAV